MYYLAFALFLFFIAFAFFTYWVVSRLLEIFSRSGEGDIGKGQRQSDSLISKAVEPLGDYLRTNQKERFAKQAAVYSQQLLEAGEFNGLRDGYDLIGMKFLSAAIMPLLFGGGLGIIAGNGLIGVMVGLFGAWLGYSYPAGTLKSAAEKRKKKFFRQFPNALDIFCVCADAGLDFNISLDYVIACFVEGPVREELALMRQQLNFGKSQIVALLALANRVNVPEVSTVIGGISQAIEMGTPMATMLRSSSQEMRKKRALSAEEEAKKAVVKMTMPLLLLIMPGVFIVLLGPIIRDLISTFASLN